MMNESTTRKRRRGLIGAAVALAAIAVALPAISAADRGHGSGDDRDDTVGTIESFDADTGLLVIAPTSGDAVSGTVNDRTKIKCEDERDDDGPGDDDDHGDDEGDDGGGHSGHGGGDDKRGHGGRRGNCSPEDLTAGATVEEAELELTASGLVYEEVELR